VKWSCCLLLFLSAGFSGFAQPANSPEMFRFNGFPGIFNFSPSFDLFRPLPMAQGGNQIDLESRQNQSIFADAPQWAKDLRRGEIIFFGSFPFTVFFTRTLMDMIRTAAHDWDRRYAPWPFKSAGAVLMNNNELRAMFGIAISASLAISMADYLLIKNKRKAALED